MTDVEDLLLAVNQYNQRRRSYQTYYDYYIGAQQLKFSTPDFKRDYGAQYEGLRENLLPGLITAFTDNLGVASWGSDANDQMADDFGLGSLLGMANNETFRTGDGYVLVWPNLEGVNIPRYQRAISMVPQVDFDDPSQLQWLARCWFYREYGRVNIYYDDRVFRWQTIAPIPSLKDSKSNPFTSDMPTKAEAWTAVQDTDGLEEALPEIPHDFGAVPGCWFRQDAIDPYGHGISILDDAIPLQDMLNQGLADQLVLQSSYSRPFWYLLNYKPQASAQNPLAQAQAFPNAYAGIAAALAGTPSNLPTSDDGNSTQFNRATQSIFAHDGPGPFGQLQPPDIIKLLDTGDRVALKMGRVVGLPSYYLTQTSGDVPSGASLRVLKSRMTSRIGRFQRDAEPVLKGLGELLGMPDPKITWSNPEQLDPLEQVDVAVAKKRDLGYSLEDAIADLDEPDAAGIVERAAARAAEVAQQFERGGLSMSNDDQDQMGDDEE